jgi:hypothetical protein
VSNYLGINLNMEVKELYNEKFEDIEERLTKWQIDSSHYVPKPSQT